MENKATEIRPHTTPACLCGSRFHVLLAEWEKRGGRVRAWREKELPFCSLSHVPRASLACVADALNLLYTDYTKGLDECVGRLKRRLRFFYQQSFFNSRVSAVIF